MSWDLFWHGAPDAYFVYLEAFEERQKQESELIEWQAYLTGLYHYTALANLSPIMVAFPKKGARPLPYPDKPFTVRKRLTKEQQREIDDYNIYAQNEMQKAYEKGLMLREQEATADVGSND